MPTLGIIFLNINLPFNYMSNWLEEEKSKYEDDGEDAEEGYDDIHVFSNSGIVHVEYGNSVSNDESKDLEDSQLDEDKYNDLIRDEIKLPFFHIDDNGSWFRFSGKRQSGPSTQYFVHYEGNGEVPDVYDKFMSVIDQDEWVHPTEDNQESNDLIRGLSCSEDIEMEDQDLDYLNESENGQPVIGVPSRDMVGPTIQHLSQKLDNISSFSYKPGKEEYDDHSWPDEMEHPQNADILLTEATNLDKPRILENVEERGDRVSADVASDSSSGWKKILDILILAFK